ncbi:MAG: carboxypeptidase-like regulatory domain-containing protein [Nitrospirota bacterium]
MAMEFPDTVAPIFLAAEEEEAKHDFSATSSEVSTFKIPNLPDPEIPNLSITQMDFKTVIDNPKIVPPLPPLSGFIVIPGQIGFLHQFFEAQLVVLQNAPDGTPLVVRDLMAKIVLPVGKDLSPGTEEAPGDDPLRIARQKGKENTRTLPIVKLGTTQNRLAAQQRGNALFLIEGLKEGTHDLLFEITGMLEGLPGGPVSVMATAHGSVLVRDPTFTITLSHPKTVRAGEEYTLYAVVTNTSDAVANLVSVKLEKNSVSGATLLSSEIQQTNTIEPRSSATFIYKLRSRITGQVTATTFPTAEGLIGRFALHTGVGDLSIPLSPDTIILPNHAYRLPSSVTDPAIGVLGLAYSVATAPAGALPKGMSRIPKKIVEEKAEVLGRAGLRLILGMPLTEVLKELLADLSVGPDSYLKILNESRQGKLLAEAINTIIKDAAPSNPLPHIVAVTQPAVGVISYPMHPLGPNWEIGCVMRALHEAGAYLFVLASEPLSRNDAENVSHYAVDGISPVSASLDGTGRFVVLQLANAVGPFVERSLHVSGLHTKSGQLVSTGLFPIQSHLSGEGAGVFSGQLLRAGSVVTEGLTTHIRRHDCQRVMGLPFPPLSLGTMDMKPGAIYQFDYVLQGSEITGQETSSREYESVQPPIRYAGQTVSLDLILRAKGGIEITVLDEAGNPAVEAEVLVNSATSFVSGQVVSLASDLLKTDQTGRVLFSNLPVGPYQIQARLRTKGAPVQVAATSAHIKQPGDTVSVTLQMVNYPEFLVGSVTARVLAPDGKTPVIGAWIRLTSRSGGAYGGQTDTNGFVSMSNIRTGDATLEIYDPASLEVGNMQLTVLPDQTISAVMILKGMAAVAGRVIDPYGVPVKGVLVVASPAQGQVKWQFTNDQGRFNMTALSVGPVKMTATEPERGRTAAASATLRYVGNAAQVELILSPRASIVGTLTDQAGRAVAGAEVRLLTPEGGCPPPILDPLIAAGENMARGGQGGQAQFDAAFTALVEAQMECVDAAVSENLISFIHTKTDANGNYRFSDLNLDKS